MLIGLGECGFLVLLGAGVSRGDAGSIGHGDVDGVAGGPGIGVGTSRLEAMAGRAGVGNGECVGGWGTA